MFLPGSYNDQPHLLSKPQKEHGTTLHQKGSDDKDFYTRIVIVQVRVENRSVTHLHDFVSLQAQNRINVRIKFIMADYQGDAAGREDRGADQRL